MSGFIGYPGLSLFFFLSSHRLFPREFLHIYGSCFSEGVARDFFRSGARKFYFSRQKQNFPAPRFSSHE